MSLVTQLHSGLLGEWCADRLPGVPSLVAEVQAAARTREPVRPTGAVDGDHWAAIGGAFGQRIAFAVSVEPPYSAYLGAASAGLLGGHVLDQLVAAWPTHRLLAPAHASEMRPTPSGWVDLGAGTDGPGWGLNPARAGRNDRALGYLNRWLITLLTEHALPGSVADTRDNEILIAKACWALNGLENAYRGGRIPATLLQEFCDLEGMESWDYETFPGGHRVPREIVDSLLFWAPKDVVAELVALSGRLYCRPLETLRALAGNPPAGHKLGIAQPTFVPRWAEGDVLVGDTLLDVKTVITLRDTQRVARWLWQLLTYAWLDTADRYRIRNVGLYLARHGVGCTWPIEEFAERLVGVRGARSRVPELRAEFLRLADQVMVLEDAEPLRVPAQRDRSA